MRRSHPAKFRSSVLSRALSVLAVAFVAAACSSDSPSGTGTQVDPGLGGAWAFSATIADTALHLACQESGQATLTQVDSAFSGRAEGSTTCTAPGVQSKDTLSRVLYDGTLAGTSLSFLDSGGCTYTGARSGTNALIGVVQCPLSLVGTIDTLTGTWQATR
ncbi:MAG TPA: hypothetical protein VEI06_16210 [Gemmatimonadaceae bacterium]|nr:hypothetical protein [Gemmatimonadaceae bacterium]